MVQERVDEVRHRLVHLAGVEQGQGPQRGHGGTAGVKGVDLVEEVEGRVGPAEVAMARGRLDLRAVPVRFAQAALQSKVVERDGFDLPPRRVQGAGQLEHQSRVGRVGVPQPLGHGDPLALVGGGPQRGDLALRLVLAPGGDDLAPDGTGVVGSRSQPMQPLRDLGALLMAHEGHDVTVPDRTHHRRDALGLGVERLRLNDADPAEPSPEVALDVLDRAAPQVLPLVGQNHVVGPLAGELTEALDGLVGAVPRRAEAQGGPGHPGT